MSKLTLAEKYYRSKALVQKLEEKLAKALKEHHENRSALRKELYNSPVPLSRAESQVMDCLKRKMQNKEIALALDISLRTVKFHVSQLLKKFGVKGRWDIPTE